MNQEKPEPAIWLSEDHRLSDRAYVFEDDGITAWLYLLNSQTNEILRSVLAYSVAAPSTRIDGAKMQLGMAPNLTAEFASSEAVIIERYPDDFSFKWRDDGEAVAVLYRDSPIAVASMDETHGSSRAVGISGPYGDPFNVKKYPWLADT